jgi:hypothetical protein
MKTGVKECDDYGAAIAKLAACDNLPESSREALRQAFEKLRAHVIGLPAAVRAKLASGCKTGLDAVVQIQTTAGC